MHLSSEKKLPFPVMKTGRWWGNYPKLRREEEIDVVAVNPLQKKMLLGECKYRNEKTDIQTAKLLMERSSLFAEGFQKSYVLFSKSGFDEEVTQMAGEWEMLLFTLADLYSK